MKNILQIIEKIWLKDPKNTKILLFTLLKRIFEQHQMGTHYLSKTERKRIIKTLKKFDYIDNRQEMLMKIQENDYCIASYAYKDLPDFIDYTIVAFKWKIFCHDWDRQEENWEVDDADDTKEQQQWVTFFDYEPLEKHAPKGEDLALLFDEWDVSSKGPFRNIGIQYIYIYFKIPTWEHEDDNYILLDEGEGDIHQLYLKEKILYFKNNDSIYADLNKDKPGSILYLPKLLADVKKN